MSIVSSNMISKHYCPKCQSFDLLKTHRSFVQKNILGCANKFQCRSCDTVIKQKGFDKNIPKEVPVFMDKPLRMSADDIMPTVVEETFVVAAEQKELSELLTSEVEVPTGQGDYLPEDNFRVTETMLSSTSDGKPTKNKKTRVYNAPPKLSGCEQLVDEPILVQRKKVVWPFAVGSLLVLSGAAYAYIWMPLTTHTGLNNLAQMDMSIGSPLPVASGVNINTPMRSAITSFELDKAIAVKNDLSGSVKFEIAEAVASDRVETESIGVLAAENQEVKIATEVVVENLATSVVVIPPQAQEWIVINLESPRLIGAISTKADQAESLVDVPLPSSSVRLYVVAASKRPKPSSIVKKKRVNNDTTELLEKVAVKFMQQDLDRLLPN